MSIKDAGRRGLFGLLAAAPLAVVATGARGAVPADDLNVIVGLPDGVSASVQHEGNVTKIDIIVETVERKMADRLARGGGNLGKAIDGVYGTERRGR